MFLSYSEITARKLANSIFHSAEADIKARAEIEAKALQKGSTMKINNALKQTKAARAEKIKEITDYVYDRMMKGEIEHDGDLWDSIHASVEENYDVSLKKTEYYKIVKFDLENF